MPPACTNTIKSYSQVEAEKRKARNEMDKAENAYRTSVHEVKGMIGSIKAKVTLQSVNNKQEHVLTKVYREPKSTAPRALSQSARPRSPRKSVKLNDLKQESIIWKSS